MVYTIEEIATLTGTRLFGRGNSQIEWLLTDSRSLAFPETTLFFALSSQHGDGAQYIPNLYKSGVRNFVVKTLPERWDKSYPEANFLLSPCPLSTLQRLAERHREQFLLPVIAITGSNGKTIVKEWLNQILSRKMRVTRSPRSYNSQIGVPLSVWLLNKQSEIGLFEAGISQVGEMDALRNIIQPTIGILTNIGQAHQQNFQSLKEKRAEKIKLFQNCEAVVLCSDGDVTGLNPSTKVLDWSFRNPNAFVYVSNVLKTENFTSFTYTTSGNTYEIEIPFTDDASLPNAITCLTCALYLGVSHEDIAQALKQLEPIAMRLDVIQGIHGCTLINDSYNSDLSSLDIALDFAKRRLQTQPKKFYLVLSDILQTGLNETELYKQVAELVEARRVDCVVGVGEALTRNKALFATEIRTYPTTEALLQSAYLSQLRDCMILLKGAHIYEFDRLTNVLEQKVHQTILQVNLNAIRENVNYYRSFMQKETKMVCMVKASAYGSGSIEIARTLQDCGIDYLAVAVADEGVALRKAGIHGGIMIMNPEPWAFKEIFKYDLEPEIYSFSLLKAFISAAKKEGITNWPVHIKLDTGMHRLGFHPTEDIDEVIALLKEQNTVVPRSVFSHFVGSDGKEFDEFSKLQFTLFETASKRLQNAFPHKILRHICNSAGIERFPQYHLDMVRLGLGLYGINPCNNAIINNVATLRSVILQIRDVPSGDSIGYSRRGKVERTSRIAAIPIGYADGLNRHLGRGAGYCLVNGKKAFYVGNICMDVCMIDVTDIPCKEGDEVIIFGDELPVTILSDILGTIPYEVLTSVSERVPRVYFRD